MAEKTHNEIVGPALEALMSGQDVSEAAYGDANAVGGEEGEMQEGAQEGFNSSSFMDGEEASEQQESESAEGSEVSVDSGKAAKAPTPDIEEIILTDESGRKKLKVDFNNREQLKKYIQMAAGARKWQGQKDTLSRELQSVKPEYEKLKGSWDAMEQAYKSQGVAGIIDLLQGEKGAYERHLQSEMQKRQAYEEATPFEREQLDLQNQLAIERREKEEARREMREHLDRVKATEAKAQEESLKGVLYPAFDKYRFAGKLGDDVLEAELDDAVWTKAIKRLEAYEDSAITPDVVEREFRAVAGTFRKAVTTQASKEVKSAISAKKQNASEAVASKAMSGMRGSQEVDDFKTSIRSGDLMSAFKGMLSGKVKL